MKKLILLTFVYFYLFKNLKTLDFQIYEKNKSDSEKINDLYNIISKKNEEINDLKNEINNLKNKLETIEIRMKELNLESNIFYSIYDIGFIITYFLKTKNIKKILFNLLYRGTRDGKNSVNFYEKCLGKKDQIIFIQTTKGEIFGGYTEIGFNDEGKPINDNNCFLFSYQKKKIYKAKKDKIHIYDGKNYGPCFRGSNYNIINIQSNMFEDQSNTCKASESFFEGITSDYELNNGEQNFYISEMECFQLIFI
jgi:CRISPR/Cas system CSM-associated protein Csm2 small subunit